MHLPISGRIVLVDDKADEVKPIFDILGRLAIPYIYYDGSLENLPENHPAGVRFVFLDIELEGMQGQSSKTKASGITGRLKKIISVSNGPYVIIFWTQHTEDMEAVIENCAAIDIPPVAWINMDKSDWINGGVDNRDAITTRLHEKLVEIGAFLLYVEWENIVHSSTSQFTSEFSSLVPSGQNWSRDTSFLIYNLYKSYVDKNVLEDTEEQFKCACHLINRSFQDTLENKTIADLKLPDKFELVQGGMEDQNKARINSSLFIGANIVGRPSTGNVYNAVNDSLLCCLNKNIFKKDQVPNNTTLCKIIITPECDLAQNKTISIIGADDTKYPVHRVVYGIYFPVNGTLKDVNKNYNREGNDARFYIGPIWHNEDIIIIVIHSSSLSFEAENKFTEDPLFRIKRDLLFDLQANVSNHVNRLGNYQFR